MNLPRRLSTLIAGLLLSLCPSATLCQRAERIAGTISEASRVVLQGSREPQVHASEDIGSVPPDMLLSGVTLVFSRSSAQQADLDSLISTQADPSSSSFHQWLSPDQFAARFGMADADLEKAQHWLQTKGFHMDGVARSRDRIIFSGTASQVELAFGTQLHTFRISGETHFGPATDLALPAELANVTTAVLNLSDLRPEPNVHVLPPASPDLTIAGSQVHHLTPRDLATMYGVQPLYDQGYRGTNQTIAIVGQSYLDTSTFSPVALFLAAEGVHSPLIGSVLIPNSGVEAKYSGDAVESSLDLEYSGGIAPAANLLFIHSGSNRTYNVIDAMAYAITEDLAPVISVSYGICEALVSPTRLAGNTAILQQANAQGQTVVAASGDSGSTGCARYPAPGAVTLAQQSGLAVSFPASSQYVTATGGTQMSADSFAPGNTTYWSAATTADLYSPLLSYVPEIVWNEGSAGHSPLAGGGGVSVLVPRPSWQSSLPGVPASPFRLLPDVALQSSVSDPGFVFCPDAIGLTGCPLAFLGSSGGRYSIAGGTSFAAPVFAGMLALLNEKEHTEGQGNVNPILYSLAQDPKTYASAFHDITSGTISCVAGASACGSDAQISYPAAAGYDLATGLGSVDLAHLVAAWPASSAASLQSTEMLVQSPLPSATPGQSVPFTISVGNLLHGTPSSPPPPSPTGTVSVAVDGSPVNGATPLPTDGKLFFRFDYLTPTTPGSHVITATYSGDPTHAPSAGRAVLSVGNLQATGTFTLTAGNVTAPTNGSGSSQISLNTIDGYNGHVVWSISSAESLGMLAPCVLIGPLSQSNTGTAKLSIGLGTACNSPLPAASQTREPLHIEQAPSNVPAIPAERSAAGLAALFSFFLLKGRLFRGRRRLPALLSLCLLCLASALTGCGGGGSTASAPAPVPAPAPAPAGTVYHLTLAARDSVNLGITASTAFTLTVQ